MDSLSSSLSKMDPLIQGYEGMQSRMETVASQLLVQSATLDEISAQTRSLADSSGTLGRLTSSQSALLNEHQEAIDAIDEYRLQINQRLLRLEQSLNSSAPVAPAGG